MVLESIMNPKNAEDKPWHVFIIAILYSFIAIYFSHVMFPTQSSILSVALITIIFVPFFQKLFEIEEKKEDLVAKKKIKDNLFTRHIKIINVFSAFFLGVIVSMSFIFIFIPQLQDVFSLQSQVLRDISPITGASIQQANFFKFFYNNTQVMLLVFILSIMFGAGAVFIFTWNASIIAIYLGYIAQSFTNKGMAATTAYLYGLPIGLGSIALHGIPEISAYFFAGLAGGILSVGIIREKLRSKEFEKIFVDSLAYLAIAELLIILGAFLEATF
ncbi:MAG: stage II sporulation protein M [Candidatus Aenigmatarchaeota archaeon]